jgi:hypothetical protein
MVLALLCIARVGTTAGRDFEGSGITVGAVDWMTGWLEWSWVSASDPTISGYVLKCGSTAGAYTIRREFPPTQVAVQMTQVFPRPGRYFCAVAVMHARVDGENSAELSFTSQADSTIPLPPTGFQVLP